MDAQIIPADTDYRMFSYDYYGTLPGVDIAFLLDSSAYHTHEDAPHRVRPGTVQVMPCLSCLPICLKRLHLSSSKLQVPAENAKQSIAIEGRAQGLLPTAPVSITLYNGPTVLIMMQSSKFERSFTSICRPLNTVCRSRSVIHQSCAFLSTYPCLHTVGHTCVDSCCKPPLQSGEHCYASEKVLDPILEGEF